MQGVCKRPETYVRLVMALATKKVGMTREELSAASGIAESGKMTQCLDDLDRCGFIRKYTPLGKTNRGSVYQLMDNFTLFYFSFMASRKGGDRRYWSKLQSTSKQEAEDVQRKKLAFNPDNSR